jgi:hypothetical protein
MPPLESDGGSGLLSSLVQADGCVLVLLGTGEAVALADELLAVARMRAGRAVWSPKLAGGGQ